MHCPTVLNIGRLVHCFVIVIKAEKVGGRAVSSGGAALIVTFSSLVLYKLEKVAITALSPRSQN